MKSTAVRLRCAGLMALTLLYFVGLLYFTRYLGISSSEAKLYFEGDGLLFWLTHVSTALLGQNDLALRLPFILTHMLNLALFWLLMRRESFSLNERIFSFLVLMALPGLNSAALLVTMAGPLLTGLLLVILLYDDSWRRYLAYMFIAGLTLTNGAYSVMALGLFFYALRQDDKLLAVLSLVVFGIGMQLYGFDVHHRPRGFFLDTLGAYAAIFSPLPFLWFVYTLYRFGVIERVKPMVWYIALAAFGLSMLLAFRQRIPVELYAPFTVILMPWAVQSLMRSLRRRIPRYRKGLWLLVLILAGTLVLNMVMTFVNTPLYRYLEKPEKHFAYDWHGIRQTADALKAMGIEAVEVESKKLARQLRFYGVAQGGFYRMGEEAVEGAQIVSIRYNGVEIRRYYVTKINN